MASLLNLIESVLRTKRQPSIRNDVICSFMLDYEPQSSNTFIFAEHSFMESCLRLQKGIATILPLPPPRILIEVNSVFEGICHAGKMPMAMKINSTVSMLQTFLAYFIEDPEHDMRLFVMVSSCRNVNKIAEAIVIWLMEGSPYAS